MVEVGDDGVKTFVLAPNHVLDRHQNVLERHHRRALFHISISQYKTRKTNKTRRQYWISRTSISNFTIKKLVDTGVHIPTDKGEYGPAEDGHMILDHLVGSYLIRLVRTENQS